MPTARQSLGVATASNGKLYAIGGFGWNAGTGTRDALATVEEYDPATDTWAIRASMPTARWGLGVAAAGDGKLYAIGGYNLVGRFLTTVEAYDPATDTWASRAPMPTARERLGVAALITGANGNVYAIGGSNASGTLNAVEEYNPSSDTWRTREAMPTSRYGLAVAVANGTLYAIGGHNLSGALATVEQFTPDIHSPNAWSPRAPMPTAREALGAAASNGKLYAIGGSYPAPTGSGGYLATVEEYDFSAAAWAAREPLAVAREALAVAASNGRLYAIGGYNPAGGELATVEEATI